jgi:hypothetical protein
MLKYITPDVRVVISLNLAIDQYVLNGIPKG